MTQTLEIQLNGSRYPVACNAAEAPRIRQMAEQLQARIAQLRTDLGAAQVTDAHLFALMGLILMDELTELQTAAVAPATQDSDENGEEIFINAVSHLTERVNIIARRLKAA